MRPALPVAKDSQRPTRPAGVLWPGPIFTIMDRKTGLGWIRLSGSWRCGGRKVFLLIVFIQSPLTGRTARST